MGDEVSFELPPARTTPLDEGAGAFARLSDAERRLVEQGCGAEPFLWLVRSGAKVDVGNWLGDGRLWVGARPGELVLFAAGRMPYLEKIPCPELRESRYNHVTGELVLAPENEVRHPRVRMEPADGYQMLAQIHDTNC